MGLFSSGSSARRRARRKAKKMKAQYDKLASQYQALSQQYTSTVKSFQSSAARSRANYEKNFARMQREANQALTKQASSLSAQYKEQARKVAKKRRLSAAASKTADIKKSKDQRRRFTKEAMGAGGGVAGARGRSAIGSLSAPKIKMKRRRAASSSGSKRSGVTRRRPR